MAFDVDEKLANKVINEFRSMGIECIISPYEADA